MSKRGYGNWKGPLPDAVEGEDYRNPCPYGEVYANCANCAN